MTNKTLTFTDAANPTSTGHAEAVMIVNDTDQPVPVSIIAASGSVTINVDEADLAVLGAEADAAATSDTGSFSIIAFIKRGLQNWTTLLAKIPALVSGRVPVDAASGARTVFTATIANGASLSGAVNLGNTTAARLGTPATITVATNATLSFQTSHDGVTYKDLYDEYGNEYTIAAGKLAASRSFKLPLADFASIQYLKVRTGTSGTPQVQGQSTDITITAVA